MKERDQQQRKAEIDSYLDSDKPEISQRSLLFNSEMFSAPDIDSDLLYHVLLSGKFDMISFWYLAKTNNSKFLEEERFQKLMKLFPLTEHMSLDREENRSQTVERIGELERFLSLSGEEIQPFTTEHLAKDVEILRFWIRQGKEEDYFCIPCKTIVQYLTCNPTPSKRTAKKFDLLITKLKKFCDLGPIFKRLILAYPPCIQSTMVWFDILKNHGCDRLPEVLTKVASANILLPIVVRHLSKYPEFNSSFFICANQDQAIMIDLLFEHYRIREQRCRLRREFISKQRKWDLTNFEIKRRRRDLTQEEIFLKQRQAYVRRELRCYSRELKIPFQEPCWYDVFHLRRYDW